MRREQILDLYDWAPGICFRHPGKGVVETAHIVTIRPSAGGLQDVRACDECVLVMEEDQADVARRRGRDYEPGQLAADE